MPPVLVGVLVGVFVRLESRLLRDDDLEDTREDTLERTEEKLEGRPVVDEETSEEAERGSSQLETKDRRKIGVQLPQRDASRAAACCWSAGVQLVWRHWATAV